MPRTGTSFAHNEIKPIHQGRPIKGWRFPHAVSKVKHVKNPEYRKGGGRER
jgi:hypothetical protein